MCVRLPRLGKQVRQVKRAYNVSMTTTITDQNFDTEVLATAQIVLVDCYADWCGPCKALKPLLQKIADNSNGKVKLGLLDIEANPKLTARLKVTTIPKVVIFKDGEQISELLGMRKEADFQDVIDSL